MMNVNKIMRLGTLLFTIVLLVYAVMKYLSNATTTAGYYFVGALGFFVVYLSYSKKGKGKK